MLPCTPDIFWASFFDDSYLRTLYVSELDCRAFAVLDIGGTSRKLRIVPKMKLPAPVAKPIGESFACPAAPNAQHAELSASIARSGPRP